MVLHLQTWACISLLYHKQYRLYYIIPQEKCEGICQWGPSYQATASKFLPIPILVSHHVIQVTYVI